MRVTGYTDIAIIVNGWRHSSHTLELDWPPYSSNHWNDFDESLQ